MTQDVGPLRSPGMQDVARLAGVSHMTVSRVINEHPYVSDASKRRVQQAINELGYRRNTAARALVTRRSGSIGVITLATTLFGPTSTLLSVEAAARVAGYTVTVAAGAVDDRAQLTRTFEQFAEQAVEGVVVIAPHVEVVRAAEFYAATVPLIMVADAPKSARFHSVSVNQRLGARLAVRHLIELGHRDIAHLAGPSNFFDGRARVGGWRQELRSQHLPDGLLCYGDWSAASGYRCGLKILEQRVPDAVFVGNDQMALGLIQALAEAGLSVPRDVSLVGFDDVDGSDFFSPPLTTVRQDFAVLGQRCIDALVLLLAGAAVPHLSPIAPTLLVRASTATRP